MHRVTRVTQEDDCTVSFATKMWGKTKEFTAKIETQRPDERIKWRVSQGITHTGVGRGVIEDGELVEPHDDSYDEERDYSDIEDIVQQDDEESTDEEQDEESNGNGGGRERTERFKRQAERTRGGREQAASSSWTSR